MARLSFVLLLLAASTLLILDAHAQSHEGPVLRDPQRQYPVGLYLEILEDKDKQWTIEDVTSPDIAAQFVPSSEEVPSFGFTDSAYWVRFEARNEADSDTEWLLLYESASFYIDYYLPAANGEGYDVIHTGTALPFDTRDVPAGQFVFRLPIEVQDFEIVHMRFASEGTLILALTILSDDNFAQQTLTQQAFNGILYGVLFILALYNLVLFFNLRDRTYLYYVLFFSTMLLGIMALDGFAAQYLWPNQGLFAAMAIRSFMIMSFTFGLLFTISFLRTSENAPRLHKIMTALAALIVIFLGLQLIWYRETAVVHILLMLASGISMLLAGVVVWRKGYPPARYFLVGWSVVLFGFIIFLLTLIDVIPASTLGDTIIRIGLIVLALVLSTGLAERINAYRQELEEEVAGKTKDLQKEIIEHEESETRLRRIRDELATVLTVSRKVTSTLDLDDLQYLILDEAEHIIPYDGAGTFLLKDLVFEFQAYRGAGPREQMMGIGFPVSGISLLYRLVNQKQSFIVDDIAQDLALVEEVETSTGYPVKTVFGPQRSWMCVPMIAGDKVFGMIGFTHREPGYYEHDMLSLAQNLADQAAVAIENAQLYDQAQAVAVLKERTRLARELHDSATQSLYSATLISEAGKELAEEGDQENAGYYLTRVSELVQQALKDMRLLVFQLRPPVLEEEGLVMALQHRIDAVEKRAGMEVRLITDGLPPLSVPMKDQLYGIATEALNNVLKHAQADKAMIIINSDEANLSLEVRDDGQGFDPQVANNGGGMGLLNMAERAAELDADLTISSSPGEGTCIRVCAPLKTTVSKTDQDEETS